MSTPEKFALVAIICMMWVSFLVTCIAISLDGISQSMKNIADSFMEVNRG